MNSNGDSIFNSIGTFEKSNESTSDSNFDENRANWNMFKEHYLNFLISCLTTILNNENIKNNLIAFYSFEMTRLMNVGGDIDIKYVNLFTSFKLYDIVDEMFDILFQKTHSNEEYKTWTTGFIDLLKKERQTKDKSKRDDVDDLSKKIEGLDVSARRKSLKMASGKSMFSKHKKSKKYKKCKSRARK